MAQQVKNPALPLQWFESLLWPGDDPWPENFHVPWVRPKKKKKKKNQKVLQKLRVDLVRKSSKQMN